MPPPDHEALLSATIQVDNLPDSPAASHVAGDFVTRGRLETLSKVSPKADFVSILAATAFLLDGAVAAQQHSLFRSGECVVEVSSFCPAIM
jgi:hypothetical protein